MKFCAPLLAFFLAVCVSLTVASEILCDPNLHRVASASDDTCVCDKGFQEVQIQEDNNTIKICEACEDGKYKNTASNDANSCQDCPANVLPESCYGAIGPGECLPGYYLKKPNEDSTFATGAVCTSCAPGYFKEMNGNQECEECVGGEGNFNCGFNWPGECKPGYEQIKNEDDQTTGCKPCEKNYFQSRLGHYDCAKCDPIAVGCTSSFMGKCPPGTGGDPKTGSSTCAKCEEGFYSLTTSNDLCEKCDINTIFCSTESAGYCRSGYEMKDFAETNNLLVCQPCAAGKYKDNYTDIKCTTCKDGMIGCGMGYAGKAYVPADPENNGGAIAGAVIGTSIAFGLFAYALAKHNNQKQLQSMATNHHIKMQEINGSGAEAIDSENDAANASVENPLTAANPAAF